ncbi:MAG: Ig-like domain-containing protein [Lachnospiraceae bacterium]|nr:Ig-like domain-containing protein [Lachnospiraceae bacterium]
MRIKKRFHKTIITFLLIAGMVLNPVGDSLYAYEPVSTSDNTLFGNEPFGEVLAAEDAKVTENFGDGASLGEEITEEPVDDEETIGGILDEKAEDSDGENDAEARGDQNEAEEVSVGEDDGENAEENAGEDDGDNVDENAEEESDTELEDENNEEQLESSLDDNAESAENYRENSIASFREILAEETLMAVVYPADAPVYANTYVGSSQITTAIIGTTVYIKDIEILEDNNIWYLVYFFVDGLEYEGFISNAAIIYTDEDWLNWYDSDYSEYVNAVGKISGYSFIENNSHISAVNSRVSSGAGYSVQGETAYSDINQFPISYREALTNIKKNHPNWIFVPARTGLDFNTAVENEADVKSNRSWIQKTTFNVEHGFIGSPAAQSGWYYATTAGVAYYMDPRNFLTEDRIFMFEQLTYNSSYHTESAVQAVLGNTFMRGEIPGEGKTYAKAFYEIGVSRKLSPVHLASRVYQEQGSGTSGLISGTYPGYVGYYNYFNVGASGSNPIVAGLTYAKNAGWNTRYKSLQGGAQTIGNGYILKGQDTIYYQKYNVGPSSAYAKYTHQYMQNIQAPSTEGYKTWQSYKNAGSLNAPFLFTIPVYENMPEEEISITGIKVIASTNKLRAPGYISEDTTGFTQSDINANTCSVRLSVAFTPAGYSDDDTIAWTSDDETVATVDSDGTVRAVGVGKTTIRAVAVESSAYPKPTASYSITVFIPIEDIVISDTQATLRRKDTIVDDLSGLSDEEAEANRNTIKLSVSKVPENTTDAGTLTWKSSNTGVATVNQNGVVTAVKVGSATITASTKGSISGKSFSVSCKVTVTAPVYSLTLKNTINRKELSPNESFVLVPKILPSDATGDKSASWVSSDETVLAVDSSGNVKAVGVGTATITCSVYRYSQSETFEVKNSRIIIWNEAGDAIDKTLNVDFGTKISNAEYETVYNKYEGLAGEGRYFAGFFTQPDGRGVLFSSDRVIDAFNVDLYPYYISTECDFYIIPVGDFEYTGSQIKPVMEVYGISEYVNEDDTLVKEKVKLTFNKEYTVTYSNNVKVNTDSKKVPTVVITGKGNFSGTKKIFFNILPISINSGSVEAQDVKVNYNGKQIKSSISVTRNGKKLRSGTDYVLSYPSTQEGAYVQPGDWPIVISGKGAYSGSITVTETITKDINMSKVTISKIANQPFDIEGCTPEFTVYNGKTVLYKDINYSVEYVNNDKIGTAKIVLTAIEGSGFYGTKSFSFKIVGENLSKAKIVGVDGLDPILNKDYTGDENDVKQSGYIVKYPYKELDENNKWVNFERTLVEGVDYTVSYVNINKAGTAQIVFTGINAYSGVIKRNYRIDQRLISDVFAPEENISVKYLKGGSKPVIDVYDGTKLLTLNKDYTISYRDFNAVTTENTKYIPSYTITGRGNYKGSVKGYYSITDGDFGDESKVSMTIKDVVYQKKAGVFASSPAIKDLDGKTLTVNKDYKILSYTYKNDTIVTDVKGNEIQRNAGDEVDKRVDVVPVGTLLNVSVVGMKNYAGATETIRSITYRVCAYNISKTIVKVLNTKQYTYGKQVMLAGNDILITCDGVELVEGVDYYIDASSYKNNTNKGKASVTVYAIEDNPNYCGSKSISFQIAPKGIY